MVALDPAQGTQNIGRGIDGEPGATTHPELPQRYGPSSEGRGTARKALIESKVHQDQFPTIEDIPAVETGAWHYRLRHQDPVFRMGACLQKVAFVRSWCCGCVSAFRWIRFLPFSYQS